jgi:hypothetical protein
LPIADTVSWTLLCEIAYARVDLLSPNNLLMTGLNWQSGSPDMVSQTLHRGQTNTQIEPYPKQQSNFWRRNVLTRIFYPHLRRIYSLIPCKCVTCGQHCGIIITISPSKTDPNHVEVSIWLELISFPLCLITTLAELYSSFPPPCQEFDLLHFQQRLWQLYFSEENRRRNHEWGYLIGVEDELF